MKKFKFIQIITFLLTITLSLPTIVFAETDTGTQILEKSNQLQYIKSQIQRNQSLIQSLNEQSPEVLKEMEEIDALIRTVQEEIDEVNASIIEKEKSLGDVAIAREDNERILKQTKQSLTEVISTITKGEEDYLNWTAQIDSPSNINLRLEELNEIYQVCNFVISNSQSNEINIRSYEGTLKIEKQKIEEQKEMVEKKQSFIQEQYDKKLTMYQTINDKKTAYSQNLDDLDEVSTELVSAIKKLQSYGYSNKSGNIIKGKGVMKWPTNGGRITSEYGYRIHPIKKVKKLHTGLDIGGLGYGKPVLAANSGIVIYSGTIGGYGKAVIIDHGNNISTLYGHNQKLLVEVGDEVVTGQQIAEVGSTGLSTGPHIHFEVRVNGTPVDPMEWL